jgi:hypothetical protein
MALGSASARRNRSGACTASWSCRSTCSPAPTSRSASCPR